MATEVRWRRGTRAQHENFTGALSEITHDTTDNRLRLHDGSALGGFGTLMQHDMGEPNGVATLDGDGRIPVEQLGNVPYSITLASRSAAVGTFIPAAVKRILVAAYSDLVPRSASMYERVNSEPSHTGKLQTADGGWWEISSAYVSVRMFGAVGDGVADDYQAIMNAIDFVDKKGGGEVYFPNGRYRTTQVITIGDGSNTQVSTKQHRISLIGVGVGSHIGLDFVQMEGATEIIYDGTTTTQGAIVLAGPLHSMSIKSMVVNANKKASYAIIVNHVTDSYFFYTVAKGGNVSGWLFTTRSGFPTGCVYGCGNNVIFHCYSVEPGTVNACGIVLTSGVTESSSLTAQPDTANCDFIGGVYFYGGSANSAGVKLHGADNNTFTGTQFIPDASQSFGYCVLFQQWSGDTRFPCENVFHSIGAKNSVGGNSGTMGNTFTIFQEGDGADLPLMPYVNAFSHTGKEVIQGKRIWRARQYSQVTLANTNRDTASTSFSVVTGLETTLSDVKPGAKIKVSLTAMVGKLTAGSARFVIYMNGTAQGATETRVPFSAEFNNAAMSVILDASSGGTYSVGMYFASTDTNIARVTNGVLSVEELY